MKKTFYILLFVFTLFGEALSLAQNKQIDSLNNVLKNAQADTAKLSIYLKFCYICHVEDNLKYAEPALKLADKLLAQTKDERQKKNLLRTRAKFYPFYTVYYKYNGDTTNQRKYLFIALESYKFLKDTVETFNTYLNIASYYFDCGNTPTAIKYQEKATELAKQNNNKQLISYGQFQTAKMFEIIEDYKNAKEYYQKAKKTQIELKDTTALAWCVREIGVCYAGLHDTTTALKYFNEAIQLYKYKNEQKGIMTTTHEIADCYKFNGNYESAILYYQKALAMAVKMNGFEGAQFRFLNKIGNTYRDAKDYDSAFVYIMKGLKLAERVNDEHRIMTGLKVAERIEDKHRIMISNFSLAKIYFFKGNYTEAKKYFSDETYKSAQVEYGISRDMVGIEQWAFKIDSALGNHKEALNHYLLYTQLFKKYNSEDLSKQAAKEKYQEQFDKQKAEQEAKDAISAAESKKQKIILWFVSGFLLLAALLAGVIFRSLRINQKNNKIISEQKHLVEEKQKEITDSINYAQKIQSTLMASEDLLQNNLTINGGDYFVLYKPKDIVSGDFYWAYNHNSEFILVTADCTGHGVPGAFMSLLCVSYLNEIVKQQKITSPDEIFNQVRRKIVSNFKSTENSERKDGMDAVLCKFSSDKSNFEYAAANNSIIIVNPTDDKPELIELDADKMPVGVSHDNNFTPFTLGKCETPKGSMIYMFSDGYADQFGGHKGKKFMYKQMRELFLSISQMPLAQQKQTLNKTMSDWKGATEQVDDILIIGVRV